MGELNKWIGCMVGVHMGWSCIEVGRVWSFKLRVACDFVFYKKNV